LLNRQCDKRRACVSQSIIAFARQERERRPAWVGLHPHYHELTDCRRLGLDPLARLPALVVAVRALRDDPLDAERLGRGEDARAIAPYALGEVQREAVVMPG
jgi:hypothetical protein